MASSSSRVSTPITWNSGSASFTINTSSVMSDAIMFHANDWEGRVQISINTQTTPTSADRLGAYIGYITGDLGGTNTNTLGGVLFVASISTYAADTPGENPVRYSFPVDCSALGFQLYFYTPNGANHNIVVRGMLCTHRNQ